MIGVVLTNNLRLQDNPVIEEALVARNNGEKLMFLVIFSDEQAKQKFKKPQITKQKTEKPQTTKQKIEKPQTKTKRNRGNSYFSDMAFAFFIQSVKNLAKTIPISTFCCSIKKYPEIVEKYGLRKVFIMESYTPFGKKRLAAIGPNAVEVRDTLFDWGGLVNGSGSPYQVYSAFRAAVGRNVPKPNRSRRIVDVEPVRSEEWPEEPDRAVPSATRTAALRILNNYDFAHYPSTRDTPAIASSHIGVYIKNGLISIREAWDIVRIEGWRDQLIWREFFYYLTDLHGFRQLKAYSGPSWPARWTPPHRPELGQLSPRERFGLWARANTGHQFVDAGMRQMLRTGTMHNRLRMVTANYLVQHLRCDWRLGERFFACRLLDYDPAINCWSWQFIAGTGTDRYKFRPFNPDRQQKKYDPQKQFLNLYPPVPSPKQQ